MSLKNNVQQFNNIKIDRESILNNLKFYFSDKEMFKNFLKTKKDNLNYSQQELIRKNNILSNVFETSVYVVSFLFFIFFSDIFSNDFANFLFFIGLIFFVSSFAKMNFFNFFTKPEQLKGILQKYVLTNVQLQQFIDKEAPVIYSYFNLLRKGIIKSPVSKQSIFMQEVEALLKTWEKNGLTLNVKQDITYLIFSYRLEKHISKTIEKKINNNKIYTEFINSYFEYVNSDIFKEPEQSILDFFNKPQSENKPLIKS